jgi:hypothetical protein
LNAAEKFLEEFGNIDDEFIKEALDMKKKVNFKPIIAVAACAAIALAAIPIAKLFANVTVGNTTVTTPAPVVPEDDFRVLYAGTSVMDGEYIEVDYPVETEFDGLSENFIDESKRGTKKTIEIDGVKYTGVYQNSTKSDYYRDDTDNYFYKSDDIIITFYINRETGLCRMFLLGGYSTSAEKFLTRDECYAKALKHLNNYVDMENYSLMDEEESGKNNYYFSWNRSVNGIKTADSVAVLINKNGTIVAHTLEGGVDSMKDIDVSKIDIKKINESVNKKIQTIYEKYPDIEVDLSKTMLVRCANGKYILKYECLINVTNPETQKNYEELRRIVVELNL